MKKIAVLWLFLCLSIDSLAQNSQTIIDSLKLIIDTMEVTAKVGAHIDIATQYQFLPNGYDSVTVHANKALEISNANNFSAGKKRAYYYLAMAAWYGKEDFELAKEYFQKTKELLIIDNDTSRIPILDNAIGSIDLMQGKYEDALISMQRAYDGALELKDYEMLSIISPNLGIIYTNTDDPKNAIKINEAALEHLKMFDSPDKDITAVGIYMNLADLYKRTNQQDKREAILKVARVKVDSMKMFRLEARLVLAEARLMDEKGMKEEMYDFVGQQIPLFESNVGYDKEMYTSLLYLKGRGRAEKGDVAETKRIIKILKSNLDNTNIQHQKNLLQSIYDLSAMVEEYKDAYIHLDKYKTLTDSLLNTEQKEKILSIERKYQSEKKDLEIEKKKIENLELKRNNAILISAILGIAFLGLLFYLWFYIRRQKEIAKMNQIEQKMLSLQMNPHFIFNAISSIQNYLFDEGDSKKAIHHLSTFASLMRQMLENSRERFIPLEDEIEFLQNYLNLQKLRFDDRFTYEINVSDDIDTSRLSIPPLLTQPFIENAIDHGKIYLVDKGLLKINILKQGGDLVIQIVDNGLGIDNLDNNNNKHLVIKKKSLSISITNERLQLLSKLMKKKFYLEIKQNESGRGTTVYLNVPSVSLN